MTDERLGDAELKRWSGCAALDWSRADWASEDLAGLIAHADLLRAI